MGQSPNKTKKIHADRRAAHDYCLRLTHLTLPREKVGSRVGPEVTLFFQAAFW
jgi:hypothetical protein